MRWIWDQRVLLLVPKLRPASLTTWVMVALTLCLGGVPSAANAQELLERDPFAVGVAESIDKGSRFLAQSLRSAGYDKSYPMGQRALFAYALVESGLGKSSLIEQLFEELDDLPLQKSYAVAVYVMALDASLRKDPDPWQKPRFTPRSRRLVEGVDWLIRARHVGHGMWSYDSVGRQLKSGTWTDFSVTQFATLALQVALRRDLKVPVELLQEIARAHLENARPTAQGIGRIRCTGIGWWSDSGQLPSGIEDGTTTIDGTAVLFSGEGFALQGTPRGWPYTPPTRRNPDPRTTYSMTAAAVSSLIVAREGLARRAELNDKISGKIDRLIAEGMLTLRRDFGQLAPSNFDSLLRNFYYNLYSFEKALDLGGVHLLGDIDWYPTQARTLITTQRADGAWGSQADAKDVYYDRVSTSFALLFLCRATRNLRVKAPDSIVTGGGNSVTWGLSKGTVYLPSTGGVVELSQLFGLVADQRSGVALQRARELVEVAPPDDLGYLVPYLVELLQSARGDSVHRYTQQSLAKICGAGHSTPEAALRWFELWKPLHEQRDPKHFDDRVKLLQQGTAPATLELVLVKRLEQWGKLDAIPVLLQQLSASEPQVRLASHRALGNLTLQRFPFDADAALGSQREQIARWQRYWDEVGSDMLFRQEWLTLKEKLEATTESRERVALCQKIIALGERVVPEVDAILQGQSYAFDWVMIWEGLTGKRRGI